MQEVKEAINLFTGTTAPAQATAQSNELFGQSTFSQAFSNIGNVLSGKTTQEKYPLVTYEQGIGAGVIQPIKVNQIQRIEQQRIPIILVSQKPIMETRTAEARTNSSSETTPKAGATTGAGAKD